MFCIWTTGSCLNFKNLQDEMSFRGKVYVHSIWQADALQRKDPCCMDAEVPLAEYYIDIMCI